METTLVFSIVFIGGGILLLMRRGLEHSPITRISEWAVILGFIALLFQILYPDAPLEVKAAIAIPLGLAFIVLGVWPEIRARGQSRPFVPVPRTRRSLALAIVEALVGSILLLIALDVYDILLVQTLSSIGTYGFFAVDLADIIFFFIATLPLIGCLYLWRNMVARLSGRRRVKGEAPAPTTLPTDDFSVKFAEEMMKAEVRKKRADELKEHLARHYDGIIHAMQFWFEDTFPTTNPYDGPKLIYAVFPEGYPALGSARWYSLPVRTEIQNLETRTYVRDSVDQVRSHLLGENWEQWQKLCDKVNGHLDKVKALWEEIERDIKSEMKRAGLTEWDGTLTPGKPLDYYWTHFLFLNIWSDPEYFEVRGVHRWDDEELRLGKDSYNNNVEVWWLDNVWAQSKDLSKLERLKAWLTIESDKIAHTKTALSVELTLIQADFNRLHQEWRRLEDDYRGGLMRRLPQSCSRCRPLLDELAGLGA